MSGARRCAGSGLIVLGLALAEGACGGGPSADSKPMASHSSAPQAATPSADAPKRPSDAEAPVAGKGDSVPPRGVEFPELAPAPAWQIDHPPCHPAGGLGLVGAPLKAELDKVRAGQGDESLADHLLGSCEASPLKVARAFNRGGLVHHRAGRLVSGHDYWIEALRADPSYLPARFNLACALARLDRPAAAIAQLAVIANAPDGAKWIVRADTDTDFDSIRQRDDFRELVAPFVAAASAASGRLAVPLPAPPLRDDPCDRIPRPCAHEGPAGTCEVLWANIYNEAALLRLTGCLRSSGCTKDCSTHAWPPTADADAEARCARLGQWLTDPESPSLDRDWKRNKAICPRLLSALTPHGRDGASDCLRYQCPEEGCLVDLRECVTEIDKTRAREFYRVELPE